MAHVRLPQLRMTQIRMAHIGHLDAHHGGTASRDHSRHHHYGSFASRTPGHPDSIAGAENGPIDWNDLLPRHIVGICGGFVAAIGIAATLLVGPSGFVPLAAAGSAIAACGFAAEIGHGLVKTGRRFLQGVVGAGGHGDDRR